MLWRAVSGVKIPGLVGAYEGIVSRGFTPSHCAGASAGAIIAAGIASGYSPKELKSIIMDIDFKKFRDKGAWYKPRTWNFFRSLGQYQGDYFEQFMHRLLKAKGVTTFRDLLSPNTDDHRDGRYRWTLKVVAADLTLGRMVTLPNDATLYDMDPDDLVVSKAVRASMSIPFFFKPVRMDGSYLVDGGLLSNFPIHLFDQEGTPDWPTFGILLQEDSYGQAHDIHGPISFFKAMFQTLMKFHDKKSIHPEDFLHRTITVPVGKTETTNFSITRQEREELYRSGQQAAIHFLNRWTWPKYLEWAKRVRGVT